MKATELRIGNIVHDRFFTNKEIVVKSIGNDSINIVETIAGNCGIPIDKISPIPLTEERLIKFGAILTYDSKFDRSKFYEIKGETFCVRKNGEIYHYEGTEYQLGKKLDYVHELQNRIHSFTGEELELK